ncbi:MAG: ABC transporter permease [Chloroflexota bacterium]|nr:ABC transporter permease [Chloroflexota bacterium]MDP9469090.1 ABC transporter permease [Chloroflexota bacterium]
MTTRAETTTTRGAQLQIGNYILYVGFAVVFVFFAVVLYDRSFLTIGNLTNIARQTAMISIMAIGFTFVLSAGEIDLSIGAVVALSSLVTALVLRDYGVWLAVPAGLGTGIIIGLVNGLITTRVRIPSFLVTLGTLGIVNGLARWITSLKSIPVTDAGYTFVFGSGDLGPVPILFVWTGLALLIGHLVLRKTAFGRQTLATGGSRTAALYSGVKIDRIKTLSLVISAMSAALAGMLYAGRLHGARYTLGEADLLTVIAAVVIGGTSLFGGKGSVIGAVVGSLIMGIINNGLILMGLTVAQQMIFQGLIIIAAVSLTSRESARR